VRNEAGVREKFGVDPVHVPDYLALVGDSADGYPGIKGIGAVGAAKLIGEHGAIEDFPDQVLGDMRELALLFKDLARLRAEADVVADVAAMRWHGPLPAFRDVAKALGDQRLVQRADGVATGYAGG
jgi:5'-3' exonuclease